MSEDPRDLEIAALRQQLADARRERDEQAARLRASVAEAAISSAAPPPGATRASSAPVRMAIVVVVLTLKGRELPRNAYTTIGTIAV